MYSKTSGLVLGFHGCDKSIRDKVINGGSLTKSNNSYDWLGSGIYFWENDPYRAKEWAVELSKRSDSSIKEPSVVGAVIDLGFCLNMMNRHNTDYVKMCYDYLLRHYEKFKEDLPQNKNIGNNKDLLLRYLDCAVINAALFISSTEEQYCSYDTVRGLFVEGDPIYPNAGFTEKTHVQISVINPNCIKGYFLPREIDPDYPNP